MEKEDISPKSSELEQLKKYAQDLAQLYKAEKTEREELQRAHQLLQKYAKELDKALKEIREANRRIKEAYLDSIHRLCLAAEYKDDDTGDHILRLSRYCTLIAEKLGLPAEEVENIMYASPMHDLGKIGIPDKILMKPGILTKREFELMKSHTIIGARILSNAKPKILKLAQQTALSHHEKWNGEGYPNGHSGEEIPLVGRIVGLADTFDALTSRRPYKTPYPIEIALKIIKKERAEHFDPDITDIFLKNIDDILKIKAEINPDTHLSPAEFKWSKRDIISGLQAEMA